MFYQLSFITGSATNCWFVGDGAPTSGYSFQEYSYSTGSGFITRNGVNMTETTQYKITLNIPALNFKYGNSSTVQPSAIYSLIIIKV